MQTTAVIPIKRLDAAKRRLGEALGRGSRTALAQAMFFDVLAAVRRSEAIGRVIVVTADGDAAAIAASCGAETIDDEREAGQSAAAALGIARAAALGTERVLLLPGDCPLIDERELDGLLARVSPVSVAIVPDRHGTGTNALVLDPPGAIEPAFGEESCARHCDLARTAEVPFTVERVPSLELDIDTPDDLAALREALAGLRGGAARTRGVIRQMSQIGPASHAPPRVPA